MNEGMNGKVFMRFTDLKNKENEENFNKMELGEIPNVDDDLNKDTDDEDRYINESVPYDFSFIKENNLSTCVARGTTR